MSEPLSQLQPLVDGDQEFTGMVDRISPANLEQGQVAYALNRSFGEKVIRNRWGICSDPWGGKPTYSSARITASSTSLTPSMVAGDITATVPKQIYSDPSQNEVTALTITNAGAGYSDATVAAVFTGGGGTGAVGTITILGGIVTSADITSRGHGYTSTPTVSFTSGVGAGAVITPVIKPIKVYPNGTILTYYDGLTVTLTATSVGADYDANIYWQDALSGFTDICGILTYREPISGKEVLLVACNEVREDNGQGKIYAVRPGQSARTCLLDKNNWVIPMNGHDFYGPVKMIQCGNAALLLRPGAPRYYFDGSSTFVSSIADTITLACAATQIVTGDRAKFIATDGSSALGLAVSGQTYYANVSGSVVKLYNTQANAVTGGATGRIDLTSTSTGSRYYLEAIEPKSFYTSGQTGNISSVTNTIDATTLIMQATAAVSSPLNNGFIEIPSAIFVTSADTATDEVSAENHRLVPGDAIVFSGGSLPTGLTAATTYWAYPTTPNAFKVYTDQTASLSGGTSSLVDITATGTGTVAKSGVSGAAMPPLREAVYIGNRVVGIFGNDLLAIGDNFNPLVYLPLVNEIKLNTGTNDRVVAIYPFNQTTVVIFKQRSILALTNLYGDLSSLTLIEVTRDFGCVSQRSIASTGSDLIWLSQRGIVTLKQTEYGISQSMPIPLSDPISATVATIDWKSADKACGAYADNKYFCSVPVSYGTGVNDITLTFNFLTSSWDGIWSGSMLIPRQFERIFHGTENRLIWANEDGFICYFDKNAGLDRLSDGIDAPIITSVKLRAYDCGGLEHKQWTGLDISMSAIDPIYAVIGSKDGGFDQTYLRSNETRSRTAYSYYGSSTYDTTNANDDFKAPYRLDYAVTCGDYVATGENGIVLGQLQAFIDKMRLRGHSSTYQVQVDTRHGEVVIDSTVIYGLPFRIYGRQDN